MYELIEERHNPPLVQNQKEQNVFQAEIRSVYEHLIDSLSNFGEEGDYYGMSDFAVRPDLRDRARVVPPPAHHVRQLTVTILTERFYRSPYLEALCHFLRTDAPLYRIYIEQDFDPEWSLTVFLTAECAYINCTKSAEATRLSGILAALK